MSKNTSESLGDFLFHKIEHSDMMSGFIIGHLVLENLLLRGIERYDNKIGAYASKLKFSGLTEMALQLGVINQKQKAVFDSINKIRNKFAHDLHYQPLRTDLLNIFKSAETAFSDMTDGLSQGIETLSDPNWTYEPGDYTLSDLFIQIAYDISDLDDWA